MGTPRQPAASIPAGPYWAIGPYRRFRRCNWLLSPFVPFVGGYTDRHPGSKMEIPAQGSAPAHLCFALTDMEWRLTGIWPGEIAGQVGVTRRHPHVQHSIRSPEATVLPSCLRFTAVSDIATPHTWGTIDIRH